MNSKTANTIHERIIGRGTKREKAVAEAYYQYLKQRAKIRAKKLNRKYGTKIQPLELQYVDPKEIKKPSKTPVKNNLLPDVKEGDWDQNLKDLRKSSKNARSLEQRFKQGLDWDETEFYKSKKKKFHENNTQYAKNTQDTFEQKLNRLDKLYQNIKENGYKKQTELKDPAISINDKINHYLKEFNEVAVHLGRNNQKILASGTHRTTIAQILNLKEIPVRIVCRHRKLTIPEN